jgi:hypothetical protein
MAKGKLYLCNMVLDPKIEGYASLRKVNDTYTLFETYISIPTLNIIVNMRESKYNHLEYLNKKLTIINESIEYHFTPINKKIRKKIKFN